MLFEHTKIMGLTCNVLKSHSSFVKLRFPPNSVFWVGTRLYCAETAYEMRISSSQHAISAVLTTYSKPPSSSKLHYYLQLCSKSKSLNQGKQAHQKIFQCQLGQNPFLVTKLVQMYADCDDLVSAKKLFDKLSEPNVFAWTAILGFYSRHGRYEECIGAYGEMILSGIMPDGYVFPKVLRACAHFSCLRMGIRVHKDVIVSGFEIIMPVCNSLIEMYSKCGDIICAKQVFDEMVGRDLVSWNLMISGYVCNGLLGLAIELFGCINSDGCEPDAVTLNTVMDAD